MKQSSYSEAELVKKMSSSYGTRIFIISSRDPAAEPKLNQMNLVNILAPFLLVCRPIWNCLASIDFF
jgi:hypothetical protein